MKKSFIVLFLITAMISLLIINIKLKNDLSLQKSLLAKKSEEVNSLKKDLQIADNKLESIKYAREVKIWGETKSIQNNIIKFNAAGNYFWVIDEYNKARKNQYGLSDKTLLQVAYAYHKTRNTNQANKIISKLEKFSSPVPMAIALRELKKVIRKPKVFNYNYAVLEKEENAIMNVMKKVALGEKNKDARLIVSCINLNDFTTYDEGGYNCGLYNSVQKLERFNKKAWARACKKYKGHDSIYNAVDKWLNSNPENYSDTIMRWYEISKETRVIKDVVWFSPKYELDILTDRIVFFKKDSARIAPDFRLIYLKKREGQWKMFAMSIPYNSYRYAEDTDEGFKDGSDRFED